MFQEVGFSPAGLRRFFLVPSSRTTRFSFLGSLLLIASFAFAVPQMSASTTTTLALTSGGNAVSTVSSGSVVILTATVVAGSIPVTRGQVNFCDATVVYCTDIHILGVAQITSAGKAIYRFVPGVGIHRYKAIFLGTNPNPGSSSAVQPLSVTGLLPTSTYLNSLGTPGNYTLGAIVQAPKSANKLSGGQVSFLDASNGNTSIGSNPTVSLTAQNGFLGQGFQSPQIFGSSVAAGDLNRDGKMDYLITDQQGDFGVAIGTDKGSFFVIPNPKFDASVLGGKLIIGDFNCDGIADFVSLGTSNHVGIFLGNGNGTFTAAVEPATGTQPVDIVIGDWNGDGILDLAVANATNSDLTILLGNGDGTFEPVTSDLPTASALKSIASADFNGDGILDLAVLTSDTSVTIFTGNGDGTFSNSGQVITNAGLLSFVIGDFNGDGKPDLALGASNSGAGSPGLIFIYFNHGDGTFSAVPDSKTFINEKPGMMVVSDFDGDGKSDIGIAWNPAFSAYSPQNGAVFGDGKGNFGGDYYLPSIGTSLAPADFDGDGYPDILSGGSGADRPSPAIDFSRPTEFLSATLTGVSISGLGAQQIEATYAADASFGGSTSSTVTLIAKTIPPTLTLAVTPSVSTYGQQVLLSAALNTSAAPGVSTNGEPVTFFCNGSVLGTGTLSNGVATLNATSLPVGTDSLSASYGGDANFLSSNSSTVSIQVSAVPAVLSSPFAGSTLSSSATFTWAVSTGVTAYQLWLGTTAGSNNLYNSHGTLSLSETVTGLPTNGGTIFATLFSQINGVYKSNSYTFTASGTPSPAVLTSPAPGSKFTGTSATFAWAGGTGVTAYQLWLGSTPGANDLFNSGGTANLSATVNGLPSNGGTIYATLFSLIDGTYKENSYLYTAVGTPASAVLTSPITGSTLTGSSAIFTWTAGTGVTNYQLWLGTTAGSNNLYSSSGTYNHTATVTSLPTNGGTIFATLFSLIDGVYKSNAYTFTASGTSAMAVLTTPAPGSTLSGPIIAFDWTSGSGVTAYQLWVGSTAGSSDLYNSHGTTALSAMAAGLPTSGQAIYVTLFSLIDGAYKSNAYAYTSEGP